MPKIYWNIILNVKLRFGTCASSQWRHKTWTCKPIASLYFWQWNSIGVQHETRTWIGYVTTTVACWLETSEILHQLRVVVYVTTCHRSLDMEMQWQFLPLGPASVYITGDMYLYIYIYIFIYLYVYRNMCASWLCHGHPSRFAENAKKPRMVVTIGPRWATQQLCCEIFQTSGWFKRAWVMHYIILLFHEVRTQWTWLKLPLGDMPCSPGNPEAVGINHFH